MDINQIVNDPTLCTQLQGIDLSPMLKLVGLALFPVVRSLVQYLKTQWPSLVPNNAAPVAANVLGIIGNVGIGALTGLPVSASVVLGVFTGLASIIYHDAKKPGTATVVNVTK